MTPPTKFEQHPLPLYSGRWGKHPAAQHRCATWAVILTGFALMLWTLSKQNLLTLLGSRRSQHGCHHTFKFLPGLEKKLPTEDEVDWDAVPIGKLIEIECWLEYEDAPGTHCYRMAAPLDYTNPSDTRRANIAAVKYEAGGGKTPKDQVLGTMFLNFGGPGAPGVSRLRSKNPKTGKHESERFDALFESRYNVMSWDPRGIEKTWPRANCFDDPALDYALDIFDWGADTYHASSGALAHQLAMYDLNFKACQNRTGDALSFVSTTSTVRDLRLLYQAAGDDRLHFAGFSYGTAVGSFFADMFPQEVGRLWLDGVMDVPDYVFESRSWGYGIDTIDKVLQGLFQACTKAGPDRCALAKLLTAEQRQAEDKGASVLLTRTLDFIEKLRQQPLPASESDLPQILVYGHFKAVLFSTLYGPKRWPAYAEALAAGPGEGNWTAYIQSYGVISPYQAPENELFRKYRSPAANRAITAADYAENGPDRIWTVAKLKEVLQSLDKQSQFAGDVLIRESGPWPIRSPDRWFGHFNSTPAFPILFASTQLDPSCPLEGAVKMANLIPGSHLLRVADGIGHCTTSLPSKCATKVIADYLVRGKLPEPTTAQVDASAPSGLKAPETLCYLDAPPFAEIPSVKLSEEELGLLGEEDRIRARREEAQMDLTEHFADHWAKHMMQ